MDSGNPVGLHLPLRKWKFISFLVLDVVNVNVPTLDVFFVLTTLFLLLFTDIFVISAFNTVEAEKCRMKKT